MQYRTECLGSKSRFEGLDGTENSTRVGGFVNIVVHSCFVSFPSRLWEDSFVDQVVLTVDGVVVYRIG